MRTPSWSRQSEEGVGWGWEWEHSTSENSIFPNEPHVDISPKARFSGEKIFPFSRHRRPRGIFLAIDTRCCCCCWWRRLLISLSAQSIRLLINSPKVVSPAAGLRFLADCLWNYPMAGANLFFSFFQSWSPPSASPARVILVKSLV